MKNLLSITLMLLSLATFAQDGGADLFKIKTDYLQLKNENLLQLDTTTLKVLAVDQNGNVGYTLSGTSGGDGVWFIDSNNEYISYNTDLGDIRVGEPSNDLDLYVSGRVYTTEVYVLATVPTPDYVFEEDYPLRDLTELENFLKEHKHLPEIPSGKEMEARGLSVSEMNLLLLKKVEELTLYVINQQKEIDVLKKQVNKAGTVKE